MHCSVVLWEAWLFWRTFLHPTPLCPLPTPPSKPPNQSLPRRAVVGGHQAAVLALAQRGAAVDATGVVHEEEEHLERPLLTAAHRGDLDMMRLLIQV